MLLSYQMKMLKELNKDTESKFIIQVIIFQKVGLPVPIAMIILKNYS